MVGLRNMLSLTLTKEITCAYIFTKLLSLTSLTEQSRHNNRHNYIVEKEITSLLR